MTKQNKSSRKLSDLLPQVEAMAREHIRLCEAEGIRLLVYCTYRPEAEQNRLYAQGRTTPGSIVTWAKAGESYHQYRVAYDCVPIVNGKPVWGTISSKHRALWNLVGKLGKQAGLEWAGDWPERRREFVHFQWTGGLKLEDFMAGRLPDVQQA